MQWLTLQQMYIEPMEEILQTITLTPNASVPLIEVTAVYHH